MCHMGSNEVDGKEKYELKQVNIFLNLLIKYPYLIIV